MGTVVSNETLAPLCSVPILEIAPSFFFLALVCDVGESEHPSSIVVGFTLGRKATGSFHIPVSSAT
jgi:hypothetical protein